MLDYNFITKQKRSTGWFLVILFTSCGPAYGPSSKSPSSCYNKMGLTRVPVLQNVGQFYRKFRKSTGTLVSSKWQNPPWQLITIRLWWDQKRGEWVCVWGRLVLGCCVFWSWLCLLCRFSVGLSECRPKRWREPWPSPRWTTHQTWQICQSRK